MRAAVFVLCAVSSIGCALLLLRAWLADRSRLVLGALACFAGLALSNLVLAYDELALPHEELLWRCVPSAVGLAVLAFVMIRTDR